MRPTYDELVAMLKRVTSFAHLRHPEFRSLAECPTPTYKEARDMLLRAEAKETRP